MLNPDEVITTMAQQREQERAADAAHYMLRKACEARAVEMRSLLYQVFLDIESDALAAEVKQLLKEIDDASH